MRIPALVVFLLSFLESLSQSASYPKGYFRYPLQIPPRLNANFGEMRPDHFHMGLDLFTERRENLPIVAAADGYVARVKIEPGGFGRAIYLDHPNGFTTLYAHMNDFMPALEEWLKKEQYARESWSVDLPVPEGKFPVKKGQFIGYSGNTGGSMGPHVHFEIRETASEKCLNPLLFGFSIPDNVPPGLARIAVYDRRQSVYEQNPMILSLVSKAGVYTVPGVVKVNTDRVVLALQATDQMSGVPNANGIYEVRVLDGKKKIGGFVIDRVGYDETRYLNAHIDYKTKLAGGAYLQFLFPLDGDMLGIYPQRNIANAITLDDTLVHVIRLEVLDPNGNRSVAIVNIQRTGDPRPIPSLRTPVMKPGELNIFENDRLQVVVPEAGLYDSISFAYAARPNPIALSFSPQFSLHRYTVPVHLPYTVKIKPEKAIPYPLRERMLILLREKDDLTVRKARWELGWYAATFRGFGEVQLVADDQPPVLQTPGLADGATIKSLSRIVVTASDNYPAIRNFRAELDGKWLMFSQKGKTFTYKTDERLTPGPHILTLRVEDEAGNRTEKTIRFTR
jgi:murein DD-endopeptidase MepM/ murein hydrolase activator NlpD